MFARVMTSKAEHTTQFILEKVAPIFNMKGYSATSMSDITAATGLTKGAIYGNFKNKEALAVAAFDHNIRFIMDQIRSDLQAVESPIGKLFALTNYYRKYYQRNIQIGGCPILNVGVDANHTNPSLFARVKYVTAKLKDSITRIIMEGIEKGEIRSEADPNRYGGRIFSFIEGAVFTSVLLKDDSYLLDMMDHLNKMIQIELQVEG